MPSQYHGFLPQHPLFPDRHPFVLFPVSLYFPVAQPHLPTALLHLPAILLRLLPVLFHRLRAQLLPSQVLPVRLSASVGFYPAPPVLLQAVLCLLLSVVASH